MTSVQSVFIQRLAQFSVPTSTASWVLSLSALTITVAVWCAYYLNGNKKGKSEKKRIPGPTVNAFISTVVPLLAIYRNKTISRGRHLFQVVCGYTHVFREHGMWLFGGGTHSVLILSKPETVEPVLNSSEILDKGFEYDLISAWLKEGLLRSTGNKWRSRRKMLTPAFHFRILNDFFPVFNEQCRVFLTNILSTMKEGDNVDIAPLTTLLTLDTVCETAMGKKIHAQKNSSLPYVQALHTACKILPDRLLQPWFWPDFIYYRTKAGKTYKKCMEIMDKFTREVVAEKKREKLQMLKEENGNEDDKYNEGEEGEIIGMKKKRRLALLDLLLDEHLKDSSFTLEDIAEEVDNFMFAGHDTTSSGFNWAFYMIGLHPDVQKKVHDELDFIFGDDLERPITYDDIKELKYLDLVLKETRRLLPPTPFIARELKEDTNINGYLIPKGTNCGILIYMLHRDPDVFPNPEVFDPERFTLANCNGRHPYAYVPFSAGPRNCIGQRFANFQALTVTATVLRYFNLRSVDPMDKMQIVDELVLRSENGVRIVFTPRSEAIAEYLESIAAEDKKQTTPMNQE